MTEDAMEDSLQDLGPELGGVNDGELVHWMEKKPLSVGPIGVSAAALGGFALGVATALLVLAISDIVDPIVMVRRRRSAADAG